jgi:hypothetical protein
MRLFADSSSAAGAGLFALFFIVYIAFLVLMIASMWKIFAKAGQKGWTALIPILNIVVLVKVLHVEMWWIAVAIIPCTSFIAYFVLYFSLAKAYGKGAGFGIGNILLPFIFLPILGFGSAQYALEPDPLF